MLTLRLDSEQEKKLNYLADLLGLTRSEIVRKSLAVYFDMVEQSNAWSAGKELFGKYASGRSDLSANRKKLLKDRLKEKRHAKNPD